VGSSGTVWASRYEASSSATVTGWHSIAAMIGAGYSNAGKFLVGGALSTTDYGLTWHSLTGFTTSATNRQYKINKDTNNNYYVEVSKASTSGFGVVRTNYTTSGKNYKVSISTNGDLYCYVPWTDTNTTYSAGTGISISDGVISCTVSTPTYVASAGNASTVSLNSTAGTYVTSWSGEGGYGTYMRKTSLQVSTVSTNSSYRYKHDILDIKNSSILYNLRPVSFIYNKDMGLGNNKRYGFIAEEVAKIDPHLVSTIKEDNGDNVALFYNSILTLAVAEIQKLRKELDDLKSNLNI
jgi:hypothetical protein